MSDMPVKPRGSESSAVGNERVSMERPGRATWPRVGITTWEECLAVERSGSCRDTRRINYSPLRTGRDISASTW